MADLTPTMLLSALRGKVGNVVFVTTDRGIYARPLVRPRDPATPGQVSSRERMAKASKAWSTLPDSSMAAWTRYAASLAVRDRRTGAKVGPHPLNAFVSCYNKLLQIDPEAAPPVNAPARKFYGDGIRLEATVQEGEIVVTSASPNSPGITTELLLQPLTSAARRTYDEKYRLAAFHTFTPTAPGVTLPTNPGWIAVAARYIDTTTGQSSPIEPLGTLRV